MNNTFKVNQTLPYDFRKRNVPQSRDPSYVRYGTETISYIAPKIWSLVPETRKNCDSLKSFNQKIRKWKPDCTCHVGYVKSICNMLISSNNQVFSFIIIIAIIIFALCSSQDKYLHINFDAHKLNLYAFDFAMITSCGRQSKGVL